MPWSGDKQARRVIDHCMFCLQPVYEDEGRVKFFGLYVHVACYYCEIDAPDQQSARQPKAA
jgi:hypothetical protein